ncbi:MAG: N-formylglutamate amidohydrolase [Clostridia bacterium]|nr:N-formylglutamate amidohydrolase [Clostridia bacterium]
MVYRAENINKNLPIVVSIPHSGEGIPAEVGESMTKGVLLPAVDWYLPQLYDFLADIGIDSVVNHINRHVIDVNRGEMTGIGSPNQCLVYTKNTMGRDIYTKNPDRNEMKRRIEAYYKPYHNALAEIITQKKEKYGEVWLFDLHSFALGADADIVLGSLDGKTMSDDKLDAIAEIFTSNGFTVAKNAPFKGGHIIKYHGRNENVHALQVELNYQAYIARRRFGNEENPAVDGELWNDCRAKLEKSFKNIIEYINCKNRP